MYSAIRVLCLNLEWAIQIYWRNSWYGLRKTRVKAWQTGFLRWMVLMNVTKHNRIGLSWKSTIHKETSKRQGVVCICLKKGWVRAVEKVQQEEWPQLITNQISTINKINLNNKNFSKLRLWAQEINSRPELQPLTILQVNSAMCQNPKQKKRTNLQMRPKKT